MPDTGNQETENDEEHESKENDTGSYQILKQSLGFCHISTQSLYEPDVIIVRDETAEESHYSPCLNYTRTC